MHPFLEQYKKQVIPEMKAKFGYKNDLAVPRFTKIVINVGLNQEKLKDPKYLETVQSSLLKVSGQKPIFTLAKKSISSFKIREGTKIGVKVTLRGKRMYDFFLKLIHLTLPRLRDFRGIDPKIMDKKGNLTLGFKEHLAFPEIKSDELERIHGLEVTIVTTAKNNDQGRELLRLLGFPFKKE